MAYGLPEPAPAAGLPLTGGLATQGPSISPQAFCGYEFPSAPRAADVPPDEGAGPAALVVQVQPRGR